MELPKSEGVANTHGQRLSIGSANAKADLIWKFKFMQSLLLFAMNFNNKNGGYYPYKACTYN